MSLRIWITTIPSSRLSGYVNHIFTLLFALSTEFNEVPSIISDFSHLKMLGHVYVVEDAKDLAQIVRDVTRYGGAYRPEVRCFFLATFCGDGWRLWQDIYEFIQRRSDWKKIEKTVDKTMYNLSFKEDCVVCWFLRSYLSSTHMFIRLCSVSIYGAVV